MTIVVGNSRFLMEYLHRRQRPRAHSNGDRPVAAQGRVLRVYSPHTSCWLQEVGLAETRQRRVLSRSWLACSDWPLDWGWHPEDRLADDPMRAQTASQNQDEN